jgi:asparagine synthase (glutamine-hydrolysing)
MCGIVGFLDCSRDQGGEQQPHEWEHIVTRMAATMHHRGPDDAGAWVDVERGIALGHRRLSIVDLSPEGHQPMVSANGRFVVVFNGEIYNFRALRQMLETEGVAFRGHSDTEVLLAAICRWGVEQALSRFVGMFSFALWDKQDRVLTLARDRIGEKPLYYGWMGDTFLFGSELKALRVHPSWRGTMNRDVLALYIRLSYIPSPYTIYEHIKKLPPATVLHLPLDRCQREGRSFEPQPTPYWSLQRVVETGLSLPFRGTDEEAIERLHALLRESVAQQMIADVPLGAFLSGGIDSSTTVALMQEQSEQPVKTFTIGFHEDSYNEAHYANEVARRLGTDHTELYVTAEEAMAVVPRLPTLYDEPFADNSQIPTFLVSELTRRHVTVSLSGDAADELFGGYGRYQEISSWWRGIGWMPQAVRQLIARGITSLPVDWLNRGFGWLAPLVGGYGRMASVGDRLRKGANLLTSSRLDDLYYGVFLQWNDPSEAVRGSRPLQTFFEQGRTEGWPRFGDPIHLMMYVDAHTYLPDDILVKVDRASMGVSLESRVPLLDHRIVEFAWTLPLRFKVRHRQGKWLLRQILHQYLPPDLFERKKTGFGMPIGQWLRDPLREWAESLLDERRLRDEGFLQPDAIRTVWQEHCDGVRNWKYRLWTVLMFQAWLEEQQRGIEQ